LIGIGVDGLYA
jgi:6-phosphofructokinase